MLEELLGGPPLPAGALAVRVGVAPSTVSGHLRKLEAAPAWSRSRANGRRREARLAGPHVAEALEALAQHRGRHGAPDRPESGQRARRRCARRARVTTTSRAARASRSPTSCSSTARSNARRRVRRPAAGARATTATASASTPRDLHTRRPLVRACIDWTERRPHVAGALGKALLDALLAEGALKRRPDGRALNVTRDFLSDDRRSAAA